MKVGFRPGPALTILNRLKWTESCACIRVAAGRPLYHDGDFNKVLEEGLIVIEDGGKLRCTTMGLVITRIALRRMGFTLGSYIGMYGGVP